LLAVGSTLSAAEWSCSARKKCDVTLAAEAMMADHNTVMMKKPSHVCLSRHTRMMFLVLGARQATDARCWQHARAIKERRRISPLGAVHVFNILRIKISIY
jgi:hypothetical protein